MTAWNLARSPEFTCTSSIVTCMQGGPGETQGFAACTTLQLRSQCAGRGGVTQMGFIGQAIEDVTVV